MVSSSQGADASSRQYDDAEGRLSLQEVPDKISRIFFGDPQKEYQQGSSYGAPGNSYGAPYEDSYGATSYQAPANPTGYAFYANFPRDLELMMKLGHGALIVFMILAVVTIIFLVMMLIMSCSAALLGGKNNQEPYDDENAAPLRRSSRGSSTSANYQNPNSLGRNGVALDSNSKNGYLRPTTLSPSSNQNNLRSRSRGIENLARDLEDLTTSVTSSDTSPHSLGPLDRPVTPQNNNIHTRNRKIGESTPVLDGDRGTDRSRRNLGRHRNYEGTRTNQQDDASLRSRPMIPLSPVVPNINVITAPDTASSFTTEDTVINTTRKLPPTPSAGPPNTSYAIQQQPGEAWKHSSRAERPISFELAITGDSHSSDSTTDRSLDRSMPYYEVPSSNLAYVHGRNSTTHRITPSGFDPPLEGNNLDNAPNMSTHVTFRPPPPVPTSINVPLSSSDSRPYSLINRSGKDHSRLI